MMGKCVYCLRVFEEEDFVRSGVDIAMKDIDMERVDLCPECAEGVADFSGDHNLLHPDETENEFAAHED